MDHDARDKLRGYAIAVLEQKLSNDALQCALAQIEPSLTSLNDAALRRELTVLESRLELIAVFLPEDEGQQELLRIAQAMLLALEAD